MVSPYYIPGIITDEEITRDKNLSFYSIEKAVCEAFKLQPEQLRLITRKREITKARQTVFYFAKKYTRKSLAEIGYFYFKDHATALHSYRTISNLLETKDKGYYALIRKAQAIIHDKYYS